MPKGLFDKDRSEQPDDYREPSALGSRGQMSTGFRDRNKNTVPPNPADSDGTELDCSLDGDAESESDADFIGGGLGQVMEQSGLAVEELAMFYHQIPDDRTPE